MQHTFTHANPMHGLEHLLIPDNHLFDVSVQAQVRKALARPLARVVIVASFNQEPFLKKEEQEEQE